MGSWWEKEMWGTFVCELSRPLYPHEKGGRVEESRRNMPAHLGTYIPSLQCKVPKITSVVWGEILIANQPALPTGPQKVMTPKKRIFFCMACPHMKEATLFQFIQCFLLGHLESVLAHHRRPGKKDWAKSQLQITPLPFRENNMK